MCFPPCREPWSFAGETDVAIRVLGIEQAGMSLDQTFAAIEATSMAAGTKKTCASTVPSSRLSEIQTIVLRNRAASTRKNGVKARRLGLCLPHDCRSRKHSGG